MIQNAVVLTVEVILVLHWVADASVNSLLSNFRLGHSLGDRLVIIGRGSGSD